MLSFCHRNQSDANFWVGLQKYIITAALSNDHDPIMKFNDLMDKINSRPTFVFVQK